MDLIESIVNCKGYSMKFRRQLYFLVLVVILSILLTPTVSAWQLGWPVWGTKFSQDNAVLVSNTECYRCNQPSRNVHKRFLEAI